MLRSARSAWTCEDEPWLQLGHAMARPGHGRGPWKGQPWLQLGHAMARQGHGRGPWQGHAMARQGHGKGVVLLFPPGKGRPRHGVCSQPHLKG